MQILLVEDDQCTAETMTFVMTEMGHGVTHVSDAKQAIETYNPDLHDVVISDYNLGVGGTGIDVLTVLKRKFGHIRLILLTAVPSVDLAVKSMKLGAVDFMPKPLDLSSLEEALRLIARQQNERSAVVNLEDLEREEIEKAVKDSPTLQAAANKLGINLATLYRKRKRYGINTAA